MDENDDVRELATGFEKLMNLATPSFNKRNLSLEAQMEEVLVRLDELYGMLDMIQSDARLLTDESLPNVMVKMNRMHLLFKQIDDFEKLVCIIRNDCNKVDLQLKEAEKEYSSFHQLKINLPRFLSIGKKPSTSERENTKNKEPFIPANIFQTSDYIFNTEESSSLS